MPDGAHGAATTAPVTRMTTAGSGRVVWTTAWILWCAAVWWLSSRSDPARSLGISLEIPDWAAHGVEFAAGGWLARSMLRPGAGGLHLVLVAVTLCGIWGVVDEWHQSRVPGRDSSGMDVAADVVGATLGAAAASLWWLRAVRGVPDPGEPAGGQAAGARTGTENDR